ncbi:MAG: Lrp/AsnC family transcriptional regulator [Thermoplasmatales archaeon]
MKDFKLDKLDNQIIELLEEDCSLSYSEIAEKINANMWTVRDRVELLKRRGVIERCKAVIDYAKMGLGCEALLFINVRPTQLRDLITFLRAEKRVKGMTIMTGQERIIIDVIGETCIEIRKFIQQDLMKFEVELKEFNVVLEKPIK